MTTNWVGERKTTDCIHILIIDDNPLDLLALRKMLNNVECEISTIHDITSASEALGSDFDVCLLDFELGGTTAFELLAQFNLPELPGPVILLTGQRSRDVEIRAAKIGIADYLQKTTFDPIQLERSIRYSRQRHWDLRHMTHVARHDDLTGLLNRNAFVKSLEDKLDASQAFASTTYVFYIDVDAFKAVNDEYGHEVGDQMLRNIATKLKNVVRRSDLTARFGGDEFVAAVFGLHEQSVTGFCNKLMDQLNQPVEIGEYSVRCSVSIGAVRVSDTGSDISKLLSVSDQAMYRAKSEGRQRYVLYNETIDSPNFCSATLSQDLSEAIEKNQLHLCLQPQVRLNDGSLYGVEVLLRWTHPTAGNISPLRTLDIAYRHGLGRKLNHWIIQEAIRVTGKLVSMGYVSQDKRLAINISPRDVITSDVFEMIHELSAEANVHPENLQLEFVEHAAMPTSSNFLQQVEEAVAAGYSIALDDFGTGSSALIHLIDLPVDTIKLDASLIRRLSSDLKARVLVESIVRAAAKLGVETIAEGIEQESDYKLVQSLGFSAAQGFMIGSFNSMDEFTSWAEQNSNELLYKGTNQCTG